MNTLLKNRHILSRGDGLCLLLTIAMLCISGCDAMRDADRKRLPSLSKARPLGTIAGPNDSASLKRIDIHADQSRHDDWWGSKRDFVDIKRTLDVKENSLMKYHGKIVGFVKFDKPGYLRERVYDDIYGDITSGWSPRKLEIKPSKRPVYVSMEYLGGIGGKDSVQEVCWFADGAKDGIVIYSTAYPNPGSKLTAGDVYGLEQLGNDVPANLSAKTQLDRQVQFFGDVAVDAITDKLKKGNFDDAQKVLDDSARVLASMSDAYSSEGMILQKSLNAQNWAMIRMYELGLALGEPSFRAKQKKLEDVLNGPHWPKTTADPTEREYRDMLPLYSWLNDQMTGKKSALPEFDIENRGVAGHELSPVAAYLQADKAVEDKASKVIYGNADFWIAAKNFLHRNFKKSDEHLNAFFDKRHSRADAFELAAAAKLRDFEFFELHPEK